MKRSSKKYESPYAKGYQHHPKNVKKAECEQVQRLVQTFAPTINLSNNLASTIAIGNMTASVDVRDAVIAWRAPLGPQVVVVKKP